MRNYLSTIILSSILLLAPSIVLAGVNKCNDAAGVVTYSDQPCEVQGQKPAEVRDGTGFSLLESRESDKKLAQSCKVLTAKKAQCYRVESRLEAALRTNCEGPLKRDRLRQQEEQRERYRNRYRNPAPYEDPYEAHTNQKVNCSALEVEIFSFVKQNFPNALGPEDIKAIEYYFHAVPDNGRPRFATRNNYDRR